MATVKEWMVSGYVLMHKRMIVVADSAEEALEKAKLGEYHGSDTEPAGDTKLREWKAEPSPFALTPSPASK